jgi:signal peptidase II
MPVTTDDEGVRATAPSASTEFESGAAAKDGEGESANDANDAKGAKDANDAKKSGAKAAAPPPLKTTPLQWLFLLVVAGATAGLDLWSKAWAIKKLSAPMPRAVPLCVPPPGQAHYMYQRYSLHEVTLIRNYLDFRYAENCGGAWGLLHGANEKLRKPFFMLVTIGAVLFILHLYRTLEQGQRAMRWALPLVLGGAIGNLVDRMRLGYVVDFIDMHFKDKYHWPTYNIADIAITVGIGLMLIEYIIGPKKAPAPVKSKPKANATAA